MLIRKDFGFVRLPPEPKVRGSSPLGDTYRVTTYVDAFDENGSLVQNLVQNSIAVHGA